MPESREGLRCEEAHAMAVIVQDRNQLGRWLSHSAATASGDSETAGSRLRKSGMLMSSATGTLGEQGFQSDCISFGAGGRDLDQAISLRMRPKSLAALTRGRAAISG